MTRVLTCIRLQRYWLALGFVVLLTGLLWLPRHGTLPRAYYPLFALPALLSLALPGYAHWRPLLANTVVRSYLAFAAWLLLSLWWTSSSQSASNAATRPLYVLLLFVGCISLARPDLRLLRQLLCASAAIAALGTAFKLIHFFSLPPPRGRMMGGGALTNPLLSSHVFGFFFSYWAASWASEQHLRPWPLLGAALMLGAILATGSRTPLFAIALVMLWLVWQGQPRKSLHLVGGIVLALLLVSLFAPDLLLQRGLSYRPQLWSMALAQWSSAPWLGEGFNAPFRFPLAELGMVLEDPHNIALAVALELGLVGLLLWLLLYASAFRALGQCADRNLAIVVGALLIYGLGAGMHEGSNFLSRPNENWFLYWIPLALSAACWRPAPPLSAAATRSAPRGKKA